MKAIIKSFCFSVSAFAMAFAARAVDPLAVWSGFNELESGTFAADIGSLIPDAIVTTPFKHALLFKLSVIPFCVGSVDI